MSIIKNATLEELKTFFEPDEIIVALIVETDFNFMEDKELCKTYATDIYKSQV
jgi:hypothetical protein